MKVRDSFVESMCLCIYNCRYHNTVWWYLCCSKVSFP